MLRTLPARYALCLAAGALPASCASPEDEEAVARDPSPALTANPVMTQAPDGSPMTPGEWVIGEDALGAHARFGPPASEPVLALECDAGAQVLTLARAGEAAGGQTYILEAGGQRARLDMAPTGGELPMLQAEVNRTMPIFRAFAQPGNAITVTAPDGAVLRLPGAPGIGRVIDACAR